MLIIISNKVQLMFTSITPVSDTALSKDDLANMVVTQALLQLKKLTQLNNDECLSLLKKQLISEKKVDQKTSISINLINSKESDYIFSLFN